mgnify:CR=1 FL=1
MTEDDFHDQAALAALLAKPETLEAVAKAIQGVIERPDNWGITPYSQIAQAAISTIRQLTGIPQPEERNKS